MKLLLVASTLLAQNWPQAGGPDGTWAVKGSAAATEWSVAAGKNIRWRTPLPNGGQSGIAVWGDRLFLTTTQLSPHLAGLRIKATSQCFRQAI